MRRVLVTNLVDTDVLRPLDGLAEVVLGPGAGALMAREEVLRRGSDLVGIVNQAELRVDADLLDACPRLQVVANVAAGYDNLDTRLMAARGIWACNVPDAFAEATADLTMAFVLGLARNLLPADRFVRSGEWRRFEPGRWDGDRLSGRLLGIVGYGRAGRAVARRARAFGMIVRWCGRQTTGDPEQMEFADLLARSDYLTLHLPLNAATRGLMHRERFLRMKRGACFLNLSRGGTMVEQDLVDALVSGHLAGAALDVFEREPAVHPTLVSLPNVILTPHMGGGTLQSRREARLQAVENVAQVLRGQRPVTPVNEPKDLP